jgi:D-alanyl-D-alanine carboxypeptidase
VGTPDVTATAPGSEPPTPSTSAAASQQPSPSPASSPTHSAAASTATAHAVVSAVPNSEWSAIVAAGAWHAGCPASQASLRRVSVNFHGFDGRAHRGVLVVNADVASQVAAIFTALFNRGYPIHRMVPIEAYGGDDNASMAADNTSAYNCRRASQANAPPTASPHANGRAVDVNPYENPWIDDRCHCFEPDSYYGTHRSGRGAITKGSLAWTVFTSAGWIWQDNSSIDYQHFDTGYPSRPE